MIRRVLIASFLMAGLMGASGAKAQDDSADVAFWQMVQRANTPSAYQIYLQTYPNGRFAALAKLRAQGGGAPQPAGPQAASQDQPETDAPHFSVTPTVGRVGQRFTVNCGTLPSGGRFDTIIAVPAGSPSNALGSGNQGIDKEYLANCLSKTSDGTFLLGPLPPGRWEFRWITTLYNLESRPEVKARVNVVVR